MDRFIKRSVFSITFTFLSASICLGESVNILDYNAVGDGITLNTFAIQKAIDACSETGGGDVIVPAGTYLTGTLVLKDNVTLNLHHASTILGSPDSTDYPMNGRNKAVIYSSNSQNIGIKGNGQIDGNGKTFCRGDNAPNRPTLILLDECHKVRIQDVTFTNSAFWTFRMVRCDNIIINKVNIYSHVNWNNDGLDIESRNIIISDCRIDTDDDAICFKSEDPDYIVENIVVTNCILSSNCNFIKFGTASSGGFRNIAISNCTLHKANESNIRNWASHVWGVTQSTTGIAGVALEVVDGGFMDQVSISNLVMRDVQTPIFIRLGHRNRDERKGFLKNIIIEQVLATSQSNIANSITGIPDQLVENVVIKDCIFDLKGGGQESDAQKEVPEEIGGYPENRMFKQMLPAYGFYIRHAVNIILDNVQLRTHTNKEFRLAIVADDVKRLRISNSQWKKPAGKSSPLMLKDTPDAVLLNNLELE